MTACYRILLRVLWLDCIKHSIRQWAAVVAGTQPAVNSADQPSG